MTVPPEKIPSAPMNYSYAVASSIAVSGVATLSRDLLSAFTSLAISLFILFVRRSLVVSPHPFWAIRATSASSCRCPSSARR